MDYLAPLRKKFVQGLPERLRTIEERWQLRDREGVAQEVHKLKGAAGGYGFSALADAAARLEDALDAGQEPGTPNLDALFASVHAAATFDPK